MSPPSKSSVRFSRHLAAWITALSACSCHGAQKSARSAVSLSSSSPHDCVYTLGARTTVMGDHAFNMAASSLGDTILIAMDVFDESSRSSRIEGRFFDLQTSELGPAFEIVGDGARPVSPKVIAARGRFLVAWRETPPGRESSVAARTVAPNGSLGDIEWLTNDNGTYAHLASTNDDEVRLVWSIVEEREDGCILKTAKLAPGAVPASIQSLRLDDVPSCEVSPSRRGRFAAVKKGMQAALVALDPPGALKRTIVSRGYAYAPAAIETSQGALVVWEGSSPRGEDGGLRTRIVDEEDRPLGDERAFPAYHAGPVPELVSDGERLFLLTGPHSSLLELDAAGAPRGNVSELTPCSPKSGTWIETSRGPFLLWVEPQTKDDGTCPTDRFYRPGHDQAFIAPLRCAPSPT